jgi:hypothetical protein
MQGRRAFTLELIRPGYIDKIQENTQTFNGAKDYKQEFVMTSKRKI